MRGKIPDKGPINLISEESILNSFTFPPRFFNPEEVKELFCPLVSKTKVVIVLRNQADLMESLFAHAHGWKSQGADIDHSDFFIQTCFTESKTRAYFNFSDVISRYKTVFGSINVEVMLFEDFKYEQDFFLSRWASVFNVSSGQLKEFLTGHHWNRKARTHDGGYIVEKRSDSSLLTAFKVLKQSPIVGSTYDFVKTLGFFDSDRISLWLRKLQATEEIAIPPFTSEQKRLIKEQFRYSNAELPTLIGCEHEKLKRYGYI